MSEADHPSAARVTDLYERHAATWDRERSRHLMEQAWLDRFLALVPAGGDVLDAGCGAGEPIAAHLIARGFAVTGVDASAAMIALCRQRFAGSQWHQADLRTLALGRRFCGIIAWDSFFHLTPTDQRAAIRVFGAHAAPGAALMLTTGPAAGVAIGSWQGEALYHASLDPEEYRACLAAAGFAVVAFTPEDPECGAHSVWLARRETDGR